MSDPQHKRGDSFDRSGQVTATVDGSAVTDMTGWTARSHARNSKGDLIEVLQFSWIDASQRLCRLKSAGTETWPIGTIQIDVEFTSAAGDVVSTSTASIDCVRDVTYGA